MSHVLYRSVPAAVRSIDPGRHAVVEASAGTGKTYTIEHLVAGLVIEQGVPIDEILVVTFTEKAARELRERVRRILETIVETSTPERSADGDWIIDDTARARVEAARVSFDRAPISTIHGFCQRVLGELALETGAELGTSLLNEDHLFAQSWRACLRDDLLVDPVLGPAVAARVAQDADKLLASVRDALKLDAAGHYPQLVAWGRQYFDRWNELLDVDDVRAALAKQKVERDEIEHVAQRLEQIRRSAPDEAWTSYLSLDDASIATLSELRTTTGKKGPRKNLPGNATEWFGVDLQCAAARLSDDAALVLAIAPRVAARFAADKQERGAIEFDDMLNLVRDALRGPGGARVASALSDRFRYALIDEFQDTDAIQWDIFRAAFIEPGRTRVFLIGDPKQAIYRFRGADVHVYRDAVDVLEKEHGAVTVPLEHNYRSRPVLVEAYNEILRTDAEPAVFSGDVNRYDHPVRAGLGPDDLRLIDRDGNDVAPVLSLLWDGEPGVPIDTVRDELAAAMALQLRRMTRGDDALRLVDRHGERPLRARDVFILVSRWNEARPLQAALDAVGVPWALARAEGLMKSDEASTLHTLLCALASPHEKRWALAAWHTPVFGASVDELDALRDADVDHPAVASLVGWSELAQQQRWGELFDELLYGSGLIRRLLVSRDDERAVTNYMHLAELLAGYASQHRLDVSALAERLRGWISGVDKLSEGSDEQRLESERDAVQIMTMHASKGLEAPVVCCFGGYTSKRSGGGTFVRVRLDGYRLVVPGNSGAEAIKEAAQREVREEHERLDYVAITRAGARLVLPAVRSSKVGRASVWAPINARLLSMLDEHDGGAPGHEVVDARGAKVEPDAEALSTLRAWTPEGYAGVPLARGRDPRVEWRARVVPPQVSYSSLRQRGLTEAGDAADADPRADVVDAPSPGVEASYAIDAVPGGADTGLCLHEIAEFAALDAVAAAPDAATWLATDASRVLCERAARRHGIASELAGVVGAAAFAMLRTPFDLPGAGVPLEGGLASVDRMEREVEFFLALRDERASQAYVKGYIDAVACHEGRWYVVDWKSDRLEHWTDAAVRSHVDAHYGVQRTLYLMALARILGVTDRASWDERIGGWVYVFARGLPRGVGVAAGCPAWDEVASFEATLTADLARSATRGRDA